MLPALPNDFQASRFCLDRTCEGINTLVGIGKIDDDRMTRIGQLDGDTRKRAGHRGGLL